MGHSGFHLLRVDAPPYSTRSGPCKCPSYANISRQPSARWKEFVLINHSTSARRAASLLFNSYQLSIGNEIINWISNYPLEDVGRSFCWQPCHCVEPWHLCRDVISPASNWNQLPVSSQRSHPNPIFLPLLYASTFVRFTPYFIEIKAELKSGISTPFIFIIQSYRFSYIHNLLKFKSSVHSRNPRKALHRFFFFKPHRIRTTTSSPTESHILYYPTFIPLKFHFFFYSSLQNPTYSTSYHPFTTINMYFDSQYK